LLFETEVEEVLEVVVYLIEHHFVDAQLGESVIRTFLLFVLQVVVQFLEEPCYF
jgi:hypothetical protein